MKKVFVSYARMDKESVSPVVERLKSSGLQVCWDQDLSPREWRKSLGQMVRSCDHFLWMMSPASSRSLEVRSEFDMAVHAVRCVLAIKPVHPPFPDAVIRDDVRALNWLPLERLDYLMDWIARSRWDELGQVGEQTAKALSALTNQGIELTRDQAEKLSQLAMDLSILCGGQLAWVDLIVDYLEDNRWAEFEAVQAGCDRIARRVEDLARWIDSDAEIGRLMGTAGLRDLTSAMESRGPLLAWVQALEEPLNLEDREGLRQLEARYRPLADQLWALAESLTPR